MQTSKKAVHTHGARGAGHRVQHTKTNNNSAPAARIEGTRGDAAQSDAPAAQACPLFAVAATYGADGEGGTVAVHARGIGAAVGVLAARAAQRFAVKWSGGFAFESKHQRDADGAPVVKWRGGGETLSASDVDEIRGVYAVEFARASRVAVVPSALRDLWARDYAAAVGWRAVRAWRAALRAGSKLARRYLYGRTFGAGCERNETVSLASDADLSRLVAAFGRRDADGAAADDWQTGAAVSVIEDADGAASCVHPYAHGRDGAERRGGRKLSRTVGDVARLRREVAHARNCLRAHWLCGAESRKWAAGFRGDNTLLRSVVAVARGAGLSALADAGFDSLLSDGEAAPLCVKCACTPAIASGDAEPCDDCRKARRTVATDAMRARVADFRRRLASGDLLLTDKPQAVADALLIHYGARRGGAAARAMVGAIAPGIPGAARRRSLADECRSDAARALIERAAARIESARAVVVIDTGDAPRIVARSFTVTTTGRGAYRLATALQFATADVSRFTRGATTGAAARVAAAAVLATKGERRDYAARIRRGAAVRRARGRELVSMAAGRAAQAEHSARELARLREAAAYCGGLVDAAAAARLVAHYGGAAARLARAIAHAGEVRELDAATLARAATRTAAARVKARRDAARARVASCEHRLSSDAFARMIARRLARSRADFEASLGIQTA